MEASAAVAADGGQTATEGQGAEGAEGQEGQQQAQPDFGPVLERLDAFDQRFQGIESRLPGDNDGPENELVTDGQGNFFLPDGQGGFTPIDPQTGEPIENDWGLDPEADRERIRSELRAEMRQELAPIMEQLQDQQIEKLEQKYPALANMDQQQGEAFLARVEQAAQKFGNPELVHNAEFLEMQYLAGLARERAAQETPAGADDTVPLEGAGPAMPGASEEDEAARIVQAGGGLDAFWR